MINVIKGILIALATLVPGVSGGTMMIILGVYHQSIEALSQFISGKLIHKRLILHLLIGALVGFVIFASSLEQVIARFPISTSYLFLGIISAGIIIFMMQIQWQQFRPHYVLYFLLGLLIALLTTFLKQDNLDIQVTQWQYILLILISGIIIAVALILPGISTSFLLLSLGMYDDTLSALARLDFSYIVPLFIGVIFGLLVTTKLLEYLLKHRKTPTYSIILGFIVGSLFSVFPGWPASNHLTAMSFWFVIGIVVMFGLQWMASRYPDEDVI